MAISGYSLSTIKNFVGEELGVTAWMTMDVERARRESPFGSTIAHGFLTLSLAASWQYEIGIIPAGVSEALNYGLERVRFLAPVNVGARIRDRVELLAVEPKGKSRLLVKTRNTIEIEGETRPALIADTLSQLLLDA